MNAQLEVNSTDYQGSGNHLKELRPKHKQMCSMLAQGIPRETIASTLCMTPEYISMLIKQPLVQKYVQEMSAIANVQLETMFSKSVQAIGEVLENGNASDRLKAARLQMEATKRVGAGAGLIQEVVDSNSRLTKLAERLLYLQGNSARVVNQPTIIEQNEEQ